MIVVPFPDALTPAWQARILDCVRAGGILAYPTDTLYGLGGNFLLPAVHRAIDRLKGRSGVPYSAAVGSRAMMDALVTDYPPAFADLEPLLPGRFTFLLPAAGGLAAELTGGTGRVGLRMPDLGPLRRLIVASGVPWLSTSANRSGRPPMQDPHRIAAEFPGLDLVLDAGPLPLSPGSTIVDLTATPPHIVRSGADAARLEELIGRG